MDLGLPRRFDALVRRGFERLRFAALKAFQPFLNPILAYFLGSPGLGIARVAFASGIKVGQLLTVYSARYYPRTLDLLTFLWISHNLP